MRKINYLVLLAIIGAALTGCNIFNPKTPEYYLSDLLGLWQETTVKGSQHFVRFTNEASDESPYLLGREWDEAEDIYEQDLIDARETLGHPGNGWFKFELKKEGELTEIHLMDNEGAEIPKIYVITTLSDTQLAYYEKDRKSNKFTFEKVVKPSK